MKKTLTIALFIILTVFLINNGQDLIGLLTSDSLDHVVVYVQSWGILAPLISIGLMIFQAVAAPIPAFLVTSTNGLLFGLLWGTIISWTGAMLGALVAYYLAKKLGYEYVKKKVSNSHLIHKLDHLNGKYAFWIVLFARLIPVVSFDLISFAAGLAGMKMRTFLLSTGIGMLPATIAYTVLGHDMKEIETFNERMLIIIGILGILTIIGFVFRKKWLNK
ncbi:TVP38/TMEM64 family protein [Pseudalkalibacillus sp. SCS-8]|uniref:TVP38/TMEM64 family protein n=1 Tax=Pseudalkalibacillus nanhaiensis TaxID=3115291 RepID=UPI0032DB24A0